MKNIEYSATVKNPLLTRPNSKSINNIKNKKNVNWRTLQIIFETAVLNQVSIKIDHLVTVLVLFLHGLDHFITTYCMLMYSCVKSIYKCIVVKK